MNIRKKLWSFLNNCLGKHRLYTSEEVNEMRYWRPCMGCKDGHPSFWKTIVESNYWKMWEKEQADRFHSMVADKGKKKSYPGIFDVQECRACGWFSAIHFQAFMDFILKNDVNEKLVDEYIVELCRMGVSRVKQGKNRITGDIRLVVIETDEIRWHLERKYGAIPDRMFDEFEKKVLLTKMWEFLENHKFIPFYDEYRKHPRNFNNLLLKPQMRQKYKKDEIS